MPAQSNTSMVQTMAMYLLPGMSIELKVPVISGRVSGYFPAQEVDLKKFFGDDTNVGTLVNGFVVEDKRIGDLVSGNTKASIIYTHRKAQKNAIWFFAYSGEYGVMNIISVPIHDHSSIVQGGPAYGTYFSDDEEKTA